MEMKVSGRKFAITDWMKDYCDEKIGSAAKVFDIDPLEIEVVLSLEKNPANPTPAKCEVTLRASGHVIHVEENEEEIHAAIDVASAKVTRQLRKFKTRVMDKRGKAADKKATREAQGAIGDDLDLDELMADLSKDDIVKTKEFELRPMKLEEAMFDFDLLGHDFYMFLDEETEKVCVLYNRKDGGYGLLKQA